MNNREVGIVTAIAYFICGCYLQVDVAKSREVMFNDINIWAVPAWACNPNSTALALFVEYMASFSILCSFL